MARTLWTQQVRDALRTSRGVAEWSSTTSLKTENFKEAEERLFHDVCECVEVKPE